MKQSTARPIDQRGVRLTGRTFSLAKARQALRYLVRVIDDAMDSYYDAQRARADLERITSAEARRTLCERRDKAIANLNRTIDECHAVGVSMFDIPNAMVALSVNHKGVLMSVIWRIGDPIESAWTDLDTPREQRRLADYAARHG